MKIGVYVYFAVSGSTTSETMTKKTRKKSEKEIGGEMRIAAIETLHSATASRNAQKQKAKTKQKRKNAKNEN
jgi:hypothetical protein